MRKPRRNHAPRKAHWGAFKALRACWLDHLGSASRRPVILVDEAQETTPMVLGTRIFDGGGAQSVTARTGQLGEPATRGMRPLVPSWSVLELAISTERPSSRSVSCSASSAELRAAKSAGEP